MAAKKPVVQRIIDDATQNGAGHIEDTETSPVIDAPWTGNETSSFKRLTSRRHGKIKGQLELAKPKEVVVRRPSNKEFISVKPCPEGREPIAAIRDDRDRDKWYPVDPSVESELEIYCFDAYVVEVLSSVKLENGEDDYFLWVIPLTDHNGSDNEWWKSWRETAAEAEQNWVQMHAGKKKAFSIPPDEPIALPVWPSITFDEAFELAFRGLIITTLQHPHAKQLRGRK